MIMHTRLIGRINNTPIFVKADNGDDIRCRFTLLVRESQQQIAFTVFVDDKALVKNCKNELMHGATVMVEGNMVFRFHYQIQENSMIGYFDYPPVIKTDMILEANILHVLYGQKQKEMDREIKNIIVLSRTKASTSEFHLDDELPF